MKFFDETLYFNEENSKLGFTVTHIYDPEQRKKLDHGIWISIEILRMLKLSLYVSAKCILRWLISAFLTM